MQDFEVKNAKRHDGNKHEHSRAEPQLSAEERAVVEEKREEFVRDAEAALAEFKRDPSKAMDRAFKAWATIHQTKRLHAAQAQAHDAGRQADDSAAAARIERTDENLSHAKALVANLRAAAAIAVSPLVETVRIARTAGKLTPAGSKAILQAISGALQQTLRPSIIDPEAAQSMRALCEQLTTGETLETLPAGFDSLSRNLERAMEQKARKARGEAFSTVPDTIAIAREIERAGFDTLARVTGQVAAPTGADHKDTPREGSALAANTGLAGAQGRESFVSAQNGRAYEAGVNAPREAFEGSVYRAVETGRWQGYADHRWGDQRGGRYNNPGERMIYTSPSANESEAELGAYASPGQKPLAKQTMVELDYQTRVDGSTGRGGIANVSDHLGELGLTEGAFTEPKGKDGVHRTPLSNLTGEDPYLHTRAVGKGARDAGAGALRVPSATGGNQIDIIPENIDPSQIQYEQHQHHDGDGQPGPVEADLGHVLQHAPDGAGTGRMPPGDSPIPTANRLNPGHPEHFRPDASPGRTQRSGPMRYSAAGAFAGSVATELADHFIDGKPIAPLQAAEDIAMGTGVGTAAGLSAGALSARLGGGAAGLIKGGGVVGGVVTAGFSTYDNVKAVEQGKIDTTRAAANVAVDTGIGVGTGLAGAGIGAMAGSAVPVAGTAVGAVVGFAAGTVGAWVVQRVAYWSGAADYAKDRLDHGLRRIGALAHMTWDQAKLSEEELVRLLRGE